MAVAVAPCVGIVGEGFDPMFIIDPERVLET